VQNTCHNTRKRERDYFRDLGVEGSITLEGVLGNVQCMSCGLAPCGLGKEPVTVSYDCGDELRSIHTKACVILNLF
jgi:hypothetical protein